MGLLTCSRPSPVPAALGCSPLLGGVGHIASSVLRCTGAAAETPAASWARVPLPRPHSELLGALLRALRTSFQQGSAPARDPHSEETWSLSGSGVRKRSKVTCQAAPRTSSSQRVRNMSLSAKRAEAPQFVRLLPPRLAVAGEAWANSELREEPALVRGGRGGKATQTLRSTGRSRETKPRTTLPRDRAPHTAQAGPTGLPVPGPMSPPLGLAGWLGSRKGKQDS